MTIREMVVVVSIKNTSKSGNNIPYGVINMSKAIRTLSVVFMNTKTTARITVEIIQYPLKTLEQIKPLLIMVKVSTATTISSHRAMRT